MSGQAVVVSARPGPVFAHTLTGVVDARRAAPEGAHAVLVAVYEALRHAPEAMVVAEVAARLHLPLGAAVAAVGELAHAGVLRVFARSHSGDCSTLRRALAGVTRSDLPDTGAGSAVAVLVKLVVVGAAGSGVSLFLEAVCDEAPVVNAELALPVSGRQGHPEAGRERVVAVEHGSRALGEGLRLGLWGVSAMDRDQGLWLDLMRDAAGAVVLARSDRLAETARAVEAVRRPLPGAGPVPYSIAVNRVGHGDAPTAARVRELLELPAQVPVTVCDARDRALANTAVADLLHSAVAASAAERDGGVDALGGWW